VRSLVNAAANYGVSALITPTPRVIRILPWLRQDRVLLNADRW